MKYYREVPCRHEKCVACGAKKPSVSHCMESGPWGLKPDYSCDGTALQRAHDVEAALVALDNIKRILGGVGGE